MENISTNHHHIFWQRRNWSKGYLKELREYYYNKITIRESLHFNIHNSIKYVPTPNPLNAKYALEQLKMLDSYKAISKNDDIEKRLNLLIQLFKCVEDETCSALEKQLEIVHRFNNPP